MPRWAEDVIRVNGWVVYAGTTLISMGMECETPCCIWLYTGEETTAGYTAQKSSLLALTAARKPVGRG